MRVLRMTVIGVLLLLSGPGALLSQEVAELKIEFWLSTHQGVRGTQACLEDVLDAAGDLEVTCRDMRPAFLNAASIAREIEECCPAEATFEWNENTFTFREIANEHLAFADSVHSYRDQNDGAAIQRKTELAFEAVGMQFRTERLLEDLDESWENR